MQRQVLAAVRTVDSVGVDAGAVALVAAAVEGVAAEEAEEEAAVLVAVGVVVAAVEGAAAVVAAGGVVEAFLVKGGLRAECFFLW